MSILNFDEPRPKRGGILSFDETPSSGGILNFESPPKNVLNFDEERPRTLGGFGANLVKDARSVFTDFAGLGLAALPSIAGPAAGPILDALHPTKPEELLQAGKAVVDNFAEWKDPAKRIYERPLSSLIDVATVLDLPALGLRASAKVAPKMEAPLLKAAARVENPLWKGITWATDKVKGSEFFSKKFGTPEERTLHAEAVKAHDDIMNNMITARDTPKAALQQAFKPLSEAEAEQVPHAINFNKKVVLDPERQPIFDAAVGKIRNLMEQREAQLIGEGRLDPDVAEAHRWQSLAIKEGLIPVGGEVTPDVIAATRRKILDNHPDLVQRWEEQGKPMAQFGKPHGIYTTPADVESPHIDLGGKQYLWQKNPSAKVLNLEMGPPNPVLLGGRRWPVGEQTGGLAALKHFVGDQEFAALANTKRADLVKRFASEYPEVNWNRYYDAQEILEAAGGVKARKAGFDAIDAKSPDLKREWDEYIMLTPNAGTPIDITPGYFPYSIDSVKKGTPGAQEYDAVIGKNSDALPSTKITITNPGALKKSSGLIATQMDQGQLRIDPYKALAKNINTIEKMRANEKIVEYITNHRTTVPIQDLDSYVSIDEMAKTGSLPQNILEHYGWDQTGVPKTPGWYALQQDLADISAERGMNYKVIAPEGLLNFYKGQVDIIKSVENRLKAQVAKANPDLYGAIDNLPLEVGLQDFQQAVGDTLRTLFPNEEAIKTYMGVGKNQKLYAVAEPIYSAFEKSVVPGNPLAKLLLDTPNQFFKKTVLSMPRRIFNDVTGNILASFIEGTDAKAFARASMKDWQTLVPEDIMKTSQSVQVMRTPEIGNYANSPTERTLNEANRFLRGEEIEKGTMWEPMRQVLNVIPKGAQGVDWMFQKMQGLDNVQDIFFRRAAYLYEADKQAKINLGKGASEADIKAELARMKSTPAEAEEIGKRVYEFMYDYSNMSADERFMMNKLFSFYPFYKHMVRLIVKLPLKYPRKAQLLKMASVAGKKFKDMRGQALTGDPDYQAPDNQQSSLPLSVNDEGKINYLRTSGVNPFAGVLEPGSTMLTQTVPSIQFPFERLTGLQSYNLQPFESPDVTVIDGRRYDAHTGQPIEYNPVFNAAGVPSIYRHIITKFTPLGQIEQALNPNRLYPEGSPIMRNGEPIKLNQAARLAALMGINVSEPADVDLPKKMNYLNARKVLRRTGRNEP